jgi:hypothetical protein
MGDRDALIKSATHIKSGYIPSTTQGASPTHRRLLGATNDCWLRIKSENDLVVTFVSIDWMAKKSSNTSEGVGPS